VTLRVFATDVCTITVTVAEWLSEPLAPVTATGYVRVVLLDGTVTVSVDELDPPDRILSDGGLVDVLHPVGAAGVSVTVPLNPLSEVTVIVEFPEVPALIVKADGEAEIEKSGVVTGT
jgi:hypothetical protein